MKPLMTEEMREFFRKTGAQGIRKRNKLYSHADRVRWGRQGAKARAKKARKT